MATDVRESVKVMAVMMFKLDQSPSLFRNQFLFLIRKCYENKTVPNCFFSGFDPQCLSSRGSIENVSVLAVRSTQVFIDPTNVVKLADVISGYLADNFDFDDIGGNSDSSFKVLIVVCVDLFLGFLDATTQVFSAAPSWGLLDKDDEIASFFTLFRGSWNSEDSALDEAVSHLSGVPALEVFESGDWTGSCAICLEDLTAAEMNARKLPCNHIFHGRCIARWLWRNTSCPMCRSQLI